MTSAPRSRCIIPVRTNLGLCPGVELLADALVAEGLAEAIGADVRAAVDAPPYSPARVHPSGLLNAEGLVDVALRQAAAVGAALDDGVLPVVLGGDDSVLFGTLLALRRRRRHGLVFLDAHIDFYTPEQSPTGEASDSDLLLAFGNGPELIADLDGLRPLVESAAAAVLGHRDDEEQQETGAALRQSDALVVSLAELIVLGPVETARRALAHLDRAGVECFAVHVDADVLDDELMPAVDYRLPGGVGGDDFVALVGALLSDPRARAVDVTIYNPALDPDRRVAKTLAVLLTGAFGAAEGGAAAR